MVAQHFSVDEMHVAAGFNIISTPHLFSSSSPPAHPYPWVASAAQRSPLTPFLCPLIPQLLGHWKARGWALISCSDSGLPRSIAKSAVFGRELRNEWKTSRLGVGCVLVSGKPLTIPPAKPSKQRGKGTLRP